jgi:hypothetical protein
MAIVDKMPESLSTATGPAPGGGAPDRQRTGGHGQLEQESVSAQLARWLSGDGAKTLGGLIELFGQKSFAILFVLLLGVPALPLPTGGATHVFEVIAVVLAFQLVANRSEIWLPVGGESSSSRVRSSSGSSPHS